jgi:hypothetical protein
MKITLVLPYTDAEFATPVWAREEKEIDFRKDALRADRCTCAFAATELRDFLQRTIPDAEIAFAAQTPAEGMIIELSIKAVADTAGTFVLKPRQNGVQIIGQGRVGLLYGAYELLRLQGWRWYAPGKDGEVTPAPAEELILPQTTMTCAPAMSAGRGFYFEYLSMDSAELLLWMARNRLNISGQRAATQALGAKLGMSPAIGGHIFEAILDPDRPRPFGKTLWEEHEDWYGLPKAQPRNKETAQTTQFCVSQPGLRQFLDEELLRQVMGEWYDADRIGIWGFDTWGNTCNCECCQALGHSTDQMLFFMASLRETLNQARADGRLDHDVRMSMCAYEGTATIAGPSRPIPENLLRAGDELLFYPINRCYAHDFFDNNCNRNWQYAKDLQSWLTSAPRMAVGVGEYYNVSKFEDLPLLFTKRLSNDLPAYWQQGVRLMSYMHVPMVNWGVRTLTQCLYAQLCWDIETDVQAYVKEYFSRWYGPYAETMQQVYKQVEEAWLLITGWRAWDATSVLSQLRAWDGQTPQNPLVLDDHLGDPISQGERSLRLLQQALELTSSALVTEREIVALQSVGKTGVHAVNPIEERKNTIARQYEKRLAEDRRGLIYGLDTLLLMTSLVRYHDALYQGNGAAADAIWDSIESVARSLDSYYLPISYDYPGAGLVSLDALTRTQLGELLARCRGSRLQQKE